MSPLGTWYAEAMDPKLDHIHLAQDSMLHDCNEYCLDNTDKMGIKCRTCRFGCGEEATSNKGNTPGKEIREKATIEKNNRRIKHLLLPCLHSRKTGWRSKIDAGSHLTRSIALLWICMWLFLPHFADKGVSTNTSSVSCSSCKNAAWSILKITWTRGRVITVTPSLYNSFNQRGK